MAVINRGELIAQGSVADLLGKEPLQYSIQVSPFDSTVDASSGEDLTSVTLTQIILENERTHRTALPSAFLHQLIKHGEAWQDFVQRSMRSSLEGVVSSQREMERVFREWTTRAGWGAATPKPEGKREGGEPEGDKLRDEVATLRERLRALEDRLAKRKGEAK